ncbi:rCG60028 [Rattus norvegicus]|uniref:RCG60028 n=1 Tax=Rattus norvegicus TaxID=10116 RepID=A6HQU4_RAT|nr:rCG60028 [Rattus norvegicus]
MKVWSEGAVWPRTCHCRTIQ